MMNMNCLRVRALAPAILVTLLSAPLMDAGDAPIDRATLKGLKAVTVVIDPLGAALEGHGLKAAALISQIEKRLQDAGVPVSTDAADFLGVRIMSAEAKRSPAAISISLSAYQNVELAREKTIKTVTETWGVQSVLLAQPNKISQSVTETIDELTQRFIDAYRSVNPAQAQAPAPPAPAGASGTPKDQ